MKREKKTRSSSRKEKRPVVVPSSPANDAVSESLKLFQSKKYPALPAKAQESVQLDNLYDRLEKRYEAIKRKAPSPIRLIHHFACTGGTLICKFIAASPNIRLLSEVDPLSPIAKRQFSPLDLAAQFQQSSATMRDDEKIEVFLATLQTIYRQTGARGETLVLRDHPHSHFCTGHRIPKRPTLRDIVAQNFPVNSVVTVRHPLDSFLSVIANKFTHFSPVTLEEYSQRYQAFLAAHAGTPIVKYEDLIEEPEVHTPILCRALAIPYRSDAWDWIGGMALTGDSGRSGDVAQLRQRRAIPDEVVAMRNGSASYEALCSQLDYAP